MLMHIGLFKINKKFLINLPHHVSNVLTFDIKSCCGNIPHFGDHSLMESLQKIILAIKSLGYCGFKFFRKTFKLTKKCKDIEYTFEDFLTINKFLLENCFH